MRIGFNPNYKQNFTASSKVKEVYKYIDQISKKTVEEVKDELLLKIAKAKTENKTFEIGMLEAKAKELGIIK